MKWKKPLTDYVWFQRGFDPNCICYSGTDIPDVKSGKLRDY